MQVTLVDHGEESRRRLPVSRLHSVEGAAARRQVIDEAQHAARGASSFGEPKIDLDKLRAFKDKVVEKLTGGTGQRREAAQGRVHPGPRRSSTRTRSRSSRRRRRTTTLHVRARILATGSRPTTVPALSLDSPRMMDSTGALDLPDIPKSLLVVGGGYIGLELGTVYAALGTKVTVVEMTAGLLPGADRDLVTSSRKRVETIFEKILLNTKVVEVKEAKNGITVTLRRRGRPSRSEQTFDRVLVSVGRRPNSAIPGLDKTRSRSTKRLHRGR